MNKQYKEGDEVYCVLNSAVEGVISKASNYHGMWLYTLKIKDEESFRNQFSLNFVNVVFLHWQLRKIYE